MQAAYPGSGGTRCAGPGAPIPAAFFSGAAAALLGVAGEQEVASPPQQAAPAAPRAPPAPPPPAAGGRSGAGDLEDEAPIPAAFFSGAAAALLGIGLPPGGQDASPSGSRRSSGASEAHASAPSVVPPRFANAPLPVLYINDVPNASATGCASACAACGSSAPSGAQLALPVQPSMSQMLPPGCTAPASSSGSLPAAFACALPEPSNLPRAFANMARAGTSVQAPLPMGPMGVGMLPGCLEDGMGGLAGGLPLLPQQQQAAAAAAAAQQQVTAAAQAAGFVDPLERANAERAAMEAQQAAEAEARMMQELAMMQEAAAAQQAAFEQMLPEQQMAIYAAMSAASEAQLMQQCQFYDQLRAHEAERMAKSGGYFSNHPARFKDGYRPLRLCKHYNTVGCWRDDECTYAHSLDELHPASPDLPRDHLGASTTALAEQGKVEDTAPDVRLKKKKELCRKFQNKECVLGRACPYAHGEKELGTVELVVCGRVKTRICKFWASGNCMFTGNCVNAHGEAELGTKRPDFITPPMKKRREGESIDAFRQQVIAKPITKFGPGPNH